jgi:hypothetical protein
VAQVQHHADLAKRAAGLAQAGQLRDKLRLVQELEQRIVTPDEAAPDTDWEARWNALPALDAELERTLRGRFEAAQASLANQDEGREAYAQLLERNRDKLLHELLRAEIRVGIDSGPEFARERLKLQVEVLQSSLKSGHKGSQGSQGAGNAGGASSAQLRELCALPALIDTRTASRIEQLFMRLAREGK